MTVLSYVLQVIIVIFMTHLAMSAWRLCNSDMLMVAFNPFQQIFHLFIELFQVKHWSILVLFKILTHHKCWGEVPLVSIKHSVSLPAVLLKLSKYHSGILLDGQESSGYCIVVAWLRYLSEDECIVELVEGISGGLGTESELTQHVQFEGGPWWWCFEWFKSRGS